MPKKNPKKTFTPKFKLPTPPKVTFSKTFGMQGKISAMHNIQRASGRRGN